MRLKKNQSGLLEPFDEFDRPLFSHITHGSASIKREYLDELRDVFIAHGVVQVEIDGEPVSL